MKTLIIPDIHLRHSEAQRIMDKFRADHVVLLGDYFDHLNETDDAVSSTARWLSGVIKDPRVTSIVGNHDLPYWCETLDSGETGFSVRKHELINEFMRDHWVRLKFHAVVDGKWVLTHAGVSVGWFDDVASNIGIWLRGREAKYVDAIKHELSGTSGVGGGDDEDVDDPLSELTHPSGILFCEMPPIVPGVSQICGHIPMKEPVRLHKRGGVTWRLDTWLNHVMIVEDGFVTVLKTESVLAGHRTEF